VPPNHAHSGWGGARVVSPCRQSDAVGTLAFVAVAVSLRQVTIISALVGIVAKVGLFVWVGHTSDWTAGTSTLTVVTVVLGVLTMVLAAIDFVRSRWQWLPLALFVVGLLTFAPVIGYSA
jgi:hypothetical protein